MVNQYTQLCRWDGAERHHVKEARWKIPLPSFPLKLRKLFLFDFSTNKKKLYSGIEAHQTVSSPHIRYPGKTAGHTFHSTYPPINFSFLRSRLKYLLVVFIKNYCHPFSLPCLFPRREVPVRYFT
jgi:hypothetical protein